MRHRDDDFLDIEQAEADMRRLMARWGEPVQVEPPPDLVTRMARRLPAEPPHVAAGLAARRRRARQLLGSLLALPFGLVVLLGLLNAFGIGPQLALLFGDGTAGLSRILLMLQLLSKPLLGTLMSAGAPLWLACGVALGGFVLLWRWMRSRTPSYMSMENMP